MTTSFFTYVDFWKKGVLQTNHALRLFVTEEARSALSINGSWDGEVREDADSFLRVSIRNIVETDLIYERKIHVALRSDPNPYVFIEEGDRLIICEWNQRSFCKALLKLLGD